MLVVLQNTLTATFLQPDILHAVLITTTFMPDHCQYDRVCCKASTLGQENLRRPRKSHRHWCIAVSCSAWNQACAEIQGLHLT